MTGQLEFHGRVALITGTTRRRGIGAAIAAELGHQGATVVLASWPAYDREQPWGAEAGEPESIVAALREEDVEAHGISVDLAQPDGPRCAFELAEACAGTIDVLVNNASYSVDVGIDELDAEKLDRHYAVNLRATALLSAEFARQVSKLAGALKGLDLRKEFGWRFWLL